MRILRLNEQEFINVIMESTRRIILEDKRTKQARNKTMAVIKQLLGDSVDVDTFRKGFENDFYHESVYRNSPLLRLEPMICRFAIEANYSQDNQDNEKIQKIKSIMNFLYKSSVNDEIDLSKISLDTSFDEFVNTFSKMIDDKANAGVEGRKKKQYVRDNSYKIIGPVDFKTAHEYGKWSYPGLKLCYTTDETKTTWNKFTDNGFNNAYIIVKDGFENIEPVHDDDSRSPYDTYGLSMMFVFVDGNGKISNSNVRWNHEANFTGGFSVDNALDEDMISDLVGVNFESVFKPNNKWRNLLNDVLTRLHNGENPKDVFDWIGGFYNGFAKVKIVNKYNFIRQDNNELLKEDIWFDNVGYFKNGFAWVKLNNVVKYIDTNGKLYDEKEGFSLVVNNALTRLHNGEDPKNVFENFCNQSGGYNKVEIGNKYNLLKKDNTLVTEDIWFDYIDDFNNGFAKCKLGNEYKYIGTDDKIYNIEEINDVMIKNAIIRLHRGEIPDKVFDDIYKSDDNQKYYRVQIGEKYNLIREDNTLLNENIWFDYIFRFKNGFASVKLGDEYKYIDTNGKLYTEEEVFPIMAKNAMIRLHNGERPRDIFDGIYKSEDNQKYYRVQLGSKWNFFREDNNELLREDLWFDFACNFSDGYALVQLGNDCKYIDTEGNLHNNKK